MVVNDGGDLLLRHDSLDDHLGERKRDIFLDEPNNVYLSGHFYTDLIFTRIRC